MSINAPSRTIALPPRPTLADLAAWIAEDEALSIKQRQDTVSALRTLAKALQRRPEEIPAHPLYLKERLEKLNAAAVGLSLGRWRNAVSLTRVALKRAGLAFVPGRYREPLAPDWEELYRHLNDYRKRYGLSRFARYCSVSGIAPTEVNDNVLARFLDDLQRSSLNGKPQQVHRTACMVWNEAAATIPCWPKVQVTVPTYRKRYRLEWSAFPASLKEDIDAYLNRLASEDLLSEFELKPLRPASIRTRLLQFNEFASALIQRGRHPASLKMIADLVQPDAVNDGMLFYIDRPKGKEARKHAFDIAGMLKSAARHWVKVDDTHLRKLRVICKKLKPKRAGMTQKNMARLRPLADPKIARDFLNVAETIVSKLPRTGKPRRGDALLAQSALAIQILQMHTLRLYNLVHLNLERHIVRSRNGVVHLAIDGDEVKNEFVLEKEFPTTTVRLLDLYLDRYRPILLDGPSPWLFPGKSGEPKSDQQLRKQVMMNLKRYCGLDLNPHAYRHAGANLWLISNPGQYGVVRLFLGHKSVDTTTKFYCGLEAEAATRLYDENILKLRSQPDPSNTAGKRQE